MRTVKDHIGKKTAGAILAILMGCMGAFPAMASADGLSLQTEVRGVILEKTDDSITIDNEISGGYEGEFILYISDETQILDWVAKQPVAAGELSEGERISALISPAVTASIPPRSSASVIYANYKTGWDMVPGTAEDGGAIWRYILEDGKLALGWLLDEGKWYYLDPETGIMQRGFLQLDGKTYYLQIDGSMLTAPKLFIPDESGALAES